MSRVHRHSLVSTFLFLAVAAALGVSLLFAFPTTLDAAMTALSPGIPAPVATNSLLPLPTAQPYAVNLGGSLAGADLDFLVVTYATGAKGRFDALALHPYSVPRSPGDCSDQCWSFICAIEAAHNVM